MTAPFSATTRSKIFSSANACVRSAICATGQQYQSPAGPLNRFRPPQCRIDKTMIGNCAVVVAGQGEKVQGELRYNAGTGKVQDATRGALPQLQLRQPIVSFYAIKSLRLPSDLIDIRLVSAAMKTRRSRSVDLETGVE